MEISSVPFAVFSGPSYISGVNDLTRLLEAKKGKAVNEGTKCEYRVSIIIVRRILIFERIGEMKCTLLKQ